MPEAHLSIPTTAWYGRRRQLLTLVVASAMVIAFVVIWASLSAHWRSGVDFSSMYSAATLVREGGVRQIYNPQALARVGDRLMAPDHLILPFQEVALGAVGMVPLTVLRLADAFRVWTALQFLLVVASVVIAVRAAPVRLPLGALGLAAIAAIAMAGFGTEQLLSYGNWSGLNALGVAMAYRSWNRGSYAAGGAWLAGTAAIAKPHLAIGLLVFVIGWGNRRAILGAVAAGGTALIAFAALMGVEGLRSFLSTVSQDTTVWSPRGGTSIFALPSVWFNDGPMTQVVGIAGVCAALAVCFALGPPRQARAITPRGRPGRDGGAEPARCPTRLPVRHCDAGSSRGMVTGGARPLRGPSPLNLGDAVGGCRPVGSRDLDRSRSRSAASAGSLCGR